MKCPQCQAENRAGAKFCEDCGASLTSPCRACGAELTAGKKFCGSCGAPASSPATPAEPADRFASPQSYTPKHLAEKILTSKGAIEGERKIVTVMFSDVSGFTAMSEKLDPEDVHGIMDRVFEGILEAVHRHEGTINQFLGDGVMAPGVGTAGVRQDSASPNGMMVATGNGASPAGGFRSLEEAGIEDMIRLEARWRPGRWGALVSALAVAMLVSGCAALRTVCAPGTWAPTATEVAWSAGPHGTGFVPAVSCEAAQRPTAPSKVSVPEPEPK